MLGYHRPASETASKWRADDDRTVNVSLVTFLILGDPDQYSYETLYFCDFSGRGGSDPHPRMRHVFSSYSSNGIMYLRILTMREQPFDFYGLRNKKKSRADYKEKKRGPGLLKQRILKRKIERLNKRAHGPWNRSPESL